MRTYTKREMAHILQVSPRTIADDAKFLNLKPTQSDRGMNLYSNQDFNLIQQLRTHCQDKVNTRESFVPNTEVEVIEEEVKITRMPNRQSMIVDNYQESIEFGFRGDPLFDLELLQRISDRAYLLPATRLAPIVGLSPKYLNCKKIHHHCGFILTREVNVGAKYLWKVSSNRD